MFNKVMITSRFDARNRRSSPGDGGEDTMTCDEVASDAIREGFRKALRGLAATVNVISTSNGTARHGMTATAVMSLSLDPPSLVVAINQSASIHEPLRRRAAFCVNILAEGHDHVGQNFAAKPTGEARFGAGAWAVQERGSPVIIGLPYLADAQASLFCRLAGDFAFGSHTLLVGAVEDLRIAPKIAPLLYCDGGFGVFATPEALPGSDSRR
jgi:flavin reductase (DIM6/NTAB) family NADH-FMN oxidoreductase RutF